jgi:hypothetical protein
MHFRVHGARPCSAALSAAVPLPPVAIRRIFGSSALRSSFDEAGAGTAIA